MPNIIMADVPGGGMVKLASGTYTQVTSGTNAIIPVSYTGTAYQAYAVLDPDVPDVARSYEWQGAFNIPNDGVLVKTGTTGRVIAKASANNSTGWAYKLTELLDNNTVLKISQWGNGYPVVGGTYKWEIWGIR